MIVACQRGGQARVWKGFIVAPGGAEGMVLYNPTLADTETDNHWLPTVHLADGTDFVAFMEAHTGVTGSFTAGEARNGQGDVMAAFSSRGPGRPVHQARRHRAGRADPGRRIAHPADAGPGRRRQPAGRALPGDRRYVDVVAARRRRGRCWSGPCTRPGRRARSGRR